MHINDVTIVIPTSYIPSHPSTKIIEETINNSRFHFPNNEIILQIDGMREEQLKYEQEYLEYKNRVLWKCLHEWKNVLPVIFDEHSHQSTMMKKTIDLIQTSLIFYIESDLPLRIDREIDWQECFDMLGYEKANTIRFYLREEIPQEHMHLMCGQQGNFMKTVQWSQNPHLSLSNYYRNIVLPNIGEKNYIEDEFYGIPLLECESAKSKKTGIYEATKWKKHKMFIYYPDNGKNLSRLIHLDGRQSTKKFTVDDEYWGWTSIEDAKKILKDKEYVK
jgi:hypothetical protein